MWHPACSSYGRATIGMQSTAGEKTDGVRLRTVESGALAAGPDVELVCAAVAAQSEQCRQGLAPCAVSLWFWCCSPCFSVEHSSSLWFATVLYILLIGFGDG
jgi:hypothetical protein